MTLSVAAVTFACHDAATLARFWADLLETTVDPGGSQDFATIGRATESGPTLMFVRTPDQTPGKSALHLDLHAESWLPHVDRAVALGAERLKDFHEYDVEWTTLADPEGNLFDIARV
jgi:Glyoxalase-like domain